MIPYAREAGALVLVGLLAWGGYGLYKQGGKTARIELAEYKAQVATDARRVAELARDSANKARAAEQAKAAQLAAIAEKYERDKRDAEAAHNQLVAALSAGTVRLRNLWQGCQATGRVSGAAASAAESDATAREREKAAADIVRIGRDADDTIKRLQEVARKDRE